MADNKTNNNENSGVYECFHCGKRAVIWQSDFAFEDLGYEGEGLVQMCHCTNCGADIQYMISYDEEDIKEAIEKAKEQVDTNE